VTAGRRSAARHRLLRCPPLISIAASAKWLPCHRRRRSTRRIWRRSARSGWPPSSSRSARAGRSPSVGCDWKAHRRLPRLSRSRDMGRPAPRRSWPQVRILAAGALTTFERRQDGAGGDVVIGLGSSKCPTSALFRRAQYIEVRFWLGTETAVATGAIALHSDVYKNRLVWRGQQSWMMR